MSHINAANARLELVKREAEENEWRRKTALMKDEISKELQIMVDVIFDRLDLIEAQINKLQPKERNKL